MSPFLQTVPVPRSSLLFSKIIFFSPRALHRLVILRTSKCRRRKLSFPSLSLFIHPCPIFSLTSLTPVALSYTFVHCNCTLYTTSPLRDSVRSTFRATPLSPPTLVRPGTFLYYTFFFCFSFILLSLFFFFIFFSFRGVSFFSPRPFFSSLTFPPLPIHLWPGV